MDDNDKLLQELKDDRLKFSIEQKRYNTEIANNLLYGKMGKEINKAIGRKKTFKRKIKDFFKKWKIWH